MPRKRKIEASTYEKAPVATTAPEGAPKQKRARKAKVDEGAITAPNGSTDVDANDALEAAPAPRRKKATRKAKAKPAANTGADGGLTMAALADQYIAHLESIGKSRGTTFSYSIDAAMAVRHFGPETPAMSLTPEAVAAYYASDAVRMTKTGKPKAKPTVDKSKRVLRLMLTWAAETDLIPEAPLPPKSD